MSDNNHSVKIILILICCCLIILAVLGSLYYFNQGQGRYSYIRADEKFRLGTSADIREGIQILRLLAERHPQSRYAAKALFKIGYGYELLYENTKDEEKLELAKKEYENVYKRYPDSREAQNALFQIANLNFIQGNTEEALEKLDYLLSRYIDTSLKSQVYTKKGYIYLAIADYEKALKYFNQKDNLNDDNAILGKAECYFKTGEYIKAISLYEDFLKYRKTSNEYKQAAEKFITDTYNYAQDLGKKKEYTTSNALYEKIYTLFPEHKLAENALYWSGENYYDQKKTNEALAVFQKVLNNQQAGKDDASLFKMGVCYFEQKKYEMALNRFQNLIDNYRSSQYYQTALAWKRQVIREIEYRR